MLVSKISKWAINCFKETHKSVKEEVVKLNCHEKWKITHIKQVKRLVVLIVVGTILFRKLQGKHIHGTQSYSCVDFCFYYSCFQKKLYICKENTGKACIINTEK